MPTVFTPSTPLLALAAATLAAGLATGNAAAQASPSWTPTVLVRFTGQAGAQPGATPAAPPLAASGALYGATRGGQPNLGAYSQLLQGVSYRLDLASPAAASAYAQQPLGSIGAAIGTLVSAGGAIYGASSTSAVDPNQISGVGLLFRMDPASPLTAATALALPADAPVLPQRFKPRGQLAADAAGNIYLSGGVGTISCASTNNYANTLWRRGADGRYARLVDFCAFKTGTGASEVHVKGGAPVALVWSATDQALYGVSAVTSLGAYPGVAAGDSASGVLFRISKAALDAGPVADDVQILHVFAKNAEGTVLGGEASQTALAEDGDWLYGSTNAGSQGGGAVWRLRKADAASFAVVHRFGADATRHGTANGDGFQPYGPLVRAADGHLYGTTALDATQLATADKSPIGAGTLFRIRTAGGADRSADAVDVLHRFNYETQGGRPVGLSLGAVADGVQKLYGANRGGGQAGNDREAVGDGFGFGTVFSVDVPLPTAAFSTALTASATSARVGDTLTLSWATTNAAACTAGGDNGGSWDGAQQASASNVPLRAALSKVGTNTFTLQCTGVNGGAVATQSVSVTVQAAPVAPSGSGGGGGALGAWLLAPVFALALGWRRRRAG